MRTFSLPTHLASFIALVFRLPWLQAPVFKILSLELYCSEALLLVSVLAVMGENDDYGHGKIFEYSYPG